MAFGYASLRYLLNDFQKRGIFPHGKLLTLSKYEIYFTAQEFFNITNIKIDDNINGLLTDVQVFKSLGFESVESIDVSVHEGATYIHDLNSDIVPEKLQNRYDFILDCGTMEHVFHFPNVLKFIYNTLKTDGTFLFNTPCFYGFNHGFYNFQPTLFRDYFHANNYIINQMILFAYDMKNSKLLYELNTITNNIYSDNIPCLDGKNYHLCGSVTKKSNTTYDIIPQQGYYIPIWKAMEYTKQILISALDKTVYFYGTGNHTIGMLHAFSDEFENKIAGIISNDQNEFGGKFQRYTIYSIDDINKNSTIIISSIIYQDIIYNRIKHLELENINIIKLY